VSRAAAGEVPQLEVAGATHVRDAAAPPSRRMVGASERSDQVTDPVSRLGSLEVQR
jgi:hypothetical protein